jgi:MFS family permease
LRQSFFRAVTNSLLETISILKTNKPYLHFEIGFMFYGFGWMMAATVIPIYFNEVLGMNHATYGFYKNGYNLLAILLLPFFGNLMGRIDPRKFGVFTFGSMMLYLLFILLTSFYPQYWQIGTIRIYPMLLISYGFYGVFAATMALLWFIGSAYFCKKEDAAQYQSIHLTLTGVRSIFAFQIGILFYQGLGFVFTFGLAAFSLFLSVLIMYFSYKNRKYFLAHGEIL